MIAEKLAWFLYKLLCKCTGSETPQFDFAPKKPNSVWIYCATIGELNACLPFIKLWAQQYDVLLITEKPFYLEAFETSAPFATTILKSDLASNAKLALPSRFIICEIPMELYDAPFHLDYGLLRVLNQNKVDIYAVNGWLYRESFSCKEHQIAHFLLSRFYRATIKGYFVQSELTQSQLMKKGVKANKVKVMPSFKLDDINLVTSDTENVLRILKADTRPLWVAASLSSDAEIELCLNAFKQHWHSSHRLILVHRHPEKPTSIDQQKRLLEKLELRWGLFSEGALQHDVIILDTFGDLKSLYQHADVVFIGKNHNPVEPVVLAKRPLLTMDSWDDRYSTFELKTLCEEQGALHCVSTPDECLVASKRSSVDQRQFCKGSSAKDTFNLINSA
jgi:3-deoxy-D-manno-octulosonic-acid transferase